MWQNLLDAFHSTTLKLAGVATAIGTAIYMLVRIGKGVKFIVTWYEVDRAHKTNLTKALDSISEQIANMTAAQGDIRVLKKQHALLQYRQQLLLNNSGVAMFECDHAGETVAITPGYTLVTGLNLSDCAGGGWRKAVHNDDRDRITNEWMEAIKLGQLFIETYRYVHISTGVVKLCEVTARPIREDSLGVVGWIGQLRELEPQQVRT